MPTFISLTYKDRARQKSTMRLQTRAMDENNINDIQTEFSALRTALDAFTLGNLNQYEIVADRVKVSDGAAASDVARRELKLLITYEDTVTHQLYQTELPAPDLTNGGLWSDSDPEQPEYTDPAWTALVTAFEAVVVSPDSNAVTVRSGKIVGRNL